MWSAVSRDLTLPDGCHSPEAKQRPGKTLPHLTLGPGLRLLRRVEADGAMGGTQQPFNFKSPPTPNPLSPLNSKPYPWSSWPTSCTPSYAASPQSRHISPSSGLVSMSSHPCGSASTSSSPFALDELFLDWICVYLQAFFIKK